MIDYVQYVNVKLEIKIQPRVLLRRMKILFNLLIRWINWKREQLFVLFHSPTVKNSWVSL